LADQERGEHLLWIQYEYSSCQYWKGCWTLDSYYCTYWSSDVLIQ